MPWISKRTIHALHMLVNSQAHLSAGLISSEGELSSTYFQSKHIRVPLPPFFSYSPSTFPLPLQATYIDQLKAVSFSENIQGSSIIAHAVDFRLPYSFLCVTFHWNIFLIPWNSSFKVYNSVVISIFIRLCNCHLYLIPNFDHPQKKP